MKTKLILSVVFLLALMLCLASCRPKVPDATTTGTPTSDTCAHAFSEWETVKEPSCTEEGLEKRVCTLCNAEESKSIDIAPHNASAQVASAEALRLAADCESKATYWYSCADCGVVVKEAFFAYGEALGHSWNDTYSMDENNHFIGCLRDGCDAKKDVQSHNHSHANPIDTYLASEATCAKQATYYYSCTVCGHADSKTFAYGELAPHQYTEQHTCVDRKCLNCEHVEPASSAHHFGDWMEVDPGVCGGPVYKARVCLDCAYYEDNLQDGVVHPHKFVAAETSPATCTEDGLRCWVYCSRCGFTIAKEIIPALTHQMSAYISDAHGHYKECTRLGCDYETEKVAHTAIKDAAVSATCDKAGLTEGSHCQICQYVIVAQQTTPALGHDISHHEAQAPTCTKDGWEAYDKCSRCSYSTFKSIPAKGHAFTTYVSDGNATCTKDGTETATCDHGCGTKDTKTDTGSKLGHAFGSWYTTKEATCKEDGTQQRDCSRCDAFETQSISKLGHAFGSWYTTKPATCAEDGTKQRDCSRCDAYETGVIGKLGHDLESHAGKAATCTEDGWEAYVDCSRCDYNTYKVIPAKGHSYTHYISNNDATCTEDGTETATCDHDCGTKDTRTDTGSKLGHKFTAYVSNNDATCTKDGTETATCDHGCGTKDTRTDTGSKFNHKYTTYVSNNDATCTEDGTETATCDHGCGKTNTRVDTDSKLGHAFGSWYTTKPATCTEDGTKQRDCSRCDAYETGVIGKLGHDLESHAGKAATCTEDGWEAYVDCSRCDYNTYKVIPAKGHSYTHYISNNDATCTEDGTKTATCDHGCGTKDTKTDTGSKLGHAFGSWYTTKPATCTEDGTKQRDCSRCDAYETGVIGKLGHDLESHAGKAATCTEDGWEAYVDCSRCDYNTYKVIPAKGHSYTHYISNNDATCTKDGTETAICDNGCKKTNTRTATGSKLGHAFGSWYTIKEATCTENGTQQRDCSRCDAFETQSISKLGHAFGSWYITKEATCTEDGTKQRDCSRCDAFETGVVPSTGHSFSSATCTTPAICSKCEAVGQPALGHNPSAGWYFDSSVHYHICQNSGCSEHLSSASHSLIAEIDKEATASGYVFVLKQVCTVCDYEKELGRTEQHLHDSAELIEGYEPTCLAEGLTYGVKCSICGEIQLAQEVKAALGHLFVDGQCQRCGEKQHSQGLAYKLSNDGTYYIVSGIGTCTDTNLLIPPTHEGKPVKEIGYQAFYNKKSLTSVVIPDSVTKLGDYAFYGCSAIASITLGSGVGSIGSSTLGACSGIQSFIVAESNTVYASIDGNLYRKNGQTLIKYAVGKPATSFTIPYGVINISNIAFAYASNLISVTIPDSVTTIGNYAFRDCTNLASVIIPNSVKSIGNGAFYNCHKLIQKENGIHYVDTWVVGCDSNVTSAVIKEGTVGIANAAFANCTSLTSVTIPDSVSNIGSYAFQYCSGLTSVTIPPSVTSISNHMFDACTGLTSVTIPDSVTSIGSCAFDRCSGLTSVTIPDSVVVIGNSAFSRCSNLTSIIFENKEGWKAGNTPISNMELSDNAKAAAYLQSAYSSNIWTRS